MFQLLNEGVGAVNVEKNRASVRLVRLKGKYLFTPFFLDFVELLLKFKLTASTVKYTLDSRSMAEKILRNVIQA